MKVKINALKKNYLVEFKTDEEFFNFITEHNDKISSFNLLEEELPMVQKPVDIDPISHSEGWEEIDKSVIKDMTKETAPKAEKPAEETSEFKYEDDNGDKAEKVEDKEETKDIKEEVEDEADKEEPTPASELDTGIDIDSVNEDEDDDTLMELQEPVMDDEGQDQMVLCSWCNDKFPRSECKHEVDMGWICPHCIKAIESREGDLQFDEEELEEGFKDGLKKAGRGVRNAVAAGAIAGSLLSGNPANAQDMQEPVGRHVQQVYDEIEQERQEAIAWAKTLKKTDKGWEAPNGRVFSDADYADLIQGIDPQGGSNDVYQQRLNWAYDMDAKEAAAKNASK